MIARLSLKKGEDDVVDKITGQWASSERCVDIPIKEMTKGIQLADPMFHKAENVDLMM